MTISPKEFYEKLIEGDVLPTTSQPSPSEFEEVYDRVLGPEDAAVVITISAELSGTCQSACIAAAPFKESVFVVDSENATIGERILAERAWALRDEGLSAADIAYCLNQEKKDIRLVASLDTLEYLRRGGRISGAAALVGGMLSIKPVVGVVDGDVVVLGKARGSKQSKNMVFQKIDEAGGIDFTRPTRACPTRRPASTSPTAWRRRKPPRKRPPTSPPCRTICPSRRSAPSSAPTSARAASPSPSSHGNRARIVFRALS